MRDAQAVPMQQTRYVLTDTALDSLVDNQHQWQLVWSGDPYRLWRPKETGWAIVLDIQNANGIEKLDGETFFWLGNGPTAIQVFATRSGMLQLGANMLPGPSLPERPDRRLQVTVGNLISQTVTVEDGYQVLAVPAAAGNNTITLTPLDEPVAAANGADHRPLLLGIKDLAVALLETPVDGIGELTLGAIENPNGLERLDGQPFMWVGQGATVLHIESNRDGTAQLSAELLLGPSLPEKPDRRIEIATDRGYQAHITVGGGSHNFSVPIAAGSTAVEIRALDTPSQRTTNQGDPRPLLLGVKGLRIWFTKP
jgi:hypothetical protein